MISPVVLLAALVLVIALLLVLVIRRPPGERDAALLQQQLIELRVRFDALIAAQQRVPMALAEGSLAQTQVLSDVRERLGQLSEMTRRLETVGGAVTEVQQLLQVPKLRGTIGEVWLEELLRQILPASAYQMQHTFKSGDRVDAIVRVGERFVPVDAKFPLDACQRMLAATEQDAERERRAFVRSLRARVDEIADKYIRPDEGTYEFALMYIPAENVYYESLLRAQDPEDGKSIFSHAMVRKVIPVSPHTFYAYLLVILHGMKGMKFELEAREIQDQLGALRLQFEAFWVAFEKVGTHLGNAVKQFEESDRHAAKVHGRFETIAGAGPDPDVQRELDV
jgi:DNA recombination protein RmuC